MILDHGASERQNTPSQRPQSPLRPRIVGDALVKGPVDPERHNLRLAEAAGQGGAP